jgi:flagellar motor switch protein FliM
VQQIERSWRSLDLSLTPGHCIRPSTLTQIFPANEKIVLFNFEMRIADIAGPIKIALPTSFVGYLLRHLKALQSKKSTNLHLFPRPSLRERILGCIFLTSVDVTNMRVLVKDLIALHPGAILKMKALVSRPGHLTVESVNIFEAAPVRVGSQKAAQLLMRSNGAIASKE